MSVFALIVFAIVLLTPFASLKAQEADSLYRRVDSLEQAGAYRQAAEELGKLLAADPMSEQLLDRRGKAFFRAGMDEQALADLNRANKLHAPTADRLYWTAVCLFRLREPDEAYTKTIQGLKLDPKNAPLLALKADLDFSRKKYKESRAAVRKALKEDPTNLHARHTMARHLLVDKRRDEGRKAMLDVLKIDSTYAITRVSLALLDIEDKEYGASIDWALGVRDTRYNLVAASLIKQVFSLDSSVLAYIAPRRRDAVIYVEETLEQHPEYADLRNWVVESWAQLGDTLRARRQTETYLRHFNEYESGSRKAHLRIIALCFAIDCADEARAVAVIDSFASAGEITKELKAELRYEIFQYNDNWAAADPEIEYLFNLNPGSEELFRARIKNLFKLDRHTEVVDVATQGIIYNPECCICYLNRAEYKWAAGDSAGALADLQEAVRIPCDAFSPQNNRGLLLLHFQKDTLAALQDFEYLIENVPDFPYPYNNKGYILLNQGKYQEALEFINRSLALDAKNGEAYYNRALVHEKLQQTDDACADLRRALELEHKKAAEALTRLCPP